ncbi:MAG: hypothetical protein K9H41_06300 [Bacteroidia bacterium]|nr:hypothetical protein [Bacteroidia bacterium]
MKKTINTITTVFAGIALALGLTLASCKKGETGPAGPAGINGTNGVANISTFTGTTTNSSWTLSGTEFNATFNVSGITSDVVSNGTVMVFVGNTSQTQWSALPFSYQTLQFNYTYAIGQVQIAVTLSNGAVPSNPGGLPFKFVVVPPAMVKPNVNVKNYAEVKAAYNLAD